MSLKQQMTMQSPSEDSNTPQPNMMDMLMTVERRLIEANQRSGEWEARYYAAMRELMELRKKCEEQQDSNLTKSNTEN